MELSILSMVEVNMYLPEQGTFVVCNTVAKTRHQYTVERQWLEHIWSQENMFETGAAQASDC